VVKRTVDYVSAAGVTIAVVKLTGVNATSEELRLPAEDPSVTKLCQGGAVNDIQLWKGAGYTPAKVEQALKDIASDFDTALSGALASTPVTLAIIPDGGFPPIDRSGQEVTGTAKQGLNTRTVAALVGDAADALSGRFILQHDYLNYNEAADPTVVGLARDNHVHLAWQTNLWRGNLGQGAGCGGSAGNGKACTDAEYLNLLEAGIHPAGGAGPSAQGLYIEVFPYDAINHPGPIAKAHAELVGQ
jgi:hypothetical protein